jgi:hypothetical protein
MALLQSLCTAILTINGIRVGIGVAALAASSIAAPLLSFHRDAIRIPMLSIAVLGAVVNLAVLAWVWHLRARPESQWRKQEITKKQRWSNRRSRARLPEIPGPQMQWTRSTLSWESHLGPWPPGISFVTSMAGPIIVQLWRWRSFDNR